MAPEIAVVGPGAVGITVAAYLHAAGHAVQLCGRTPRQQIELRPDGGAPIVVPGPVCIDPAEVSDPVQVVMLAVKATQNDDGGRWLARLCDEQTVLVVLQNGVQHVEQVQPHCPSSAVVPGIVWFDAETQPGGWVRLRTEARLVLPTGPDAAKVAELFRGAGCTVETDPDFTTAAWRKLLVNALASLMALTGRRSGMFRRDDVASMSHRYVAECAAVARAEGANLGGNVIDELVLLSGYDTPVLNSRHRPRTVRRGTGHQRCSRRATLGDRGHPANAGTTASGAASGDRLRAGRPGPRIRECRRGPRARRVSNVDGRGPR